MIKREWVDPQPCQPDSDVLAACGGDQFLACILLRRGFSDPQRIRAFLSPEAYQPTPPEQIPDLATASALLQEGIASGKRILIWGDFDVDGQTATALLIDGLQRFGAEFSFYVPNRAAESHGISVASLKNQIDEHTPGVLITCDTGTTECDAIDYAKSIGLTVIVTDHHELGERLPNADALVNPRRLTVGHPLSSLPGVGVAYKLMQHLYTSLHQERELPHLLDLVALGIVGDVAAQTGDTRYLLQIGLERLRRTERIGLQALMEVAGLSPEKLSAEQIGYQLGPRLNATGRLGDARLAVELLVSHNRSRARILAQQLEGYNSERRVQTRKVEAAADRIIEAEPSLLDFRALVLYDPDWHPGVVGIVASRLAERYQRPVVIFTGPEGGLARGSARAAAGYDITRAIAAQADLLESYGGHPGAAGLSLPVANIDIFRERLSQTLVEMSGDRQDVSTLVIDAIVRFDELTLDLMNRIHRLAPFGEGNPPVTLAALDVQLSRSALLGRDQRHRRLTVEDGQGHRQAVIWWQGARGELPAGPFDIAFTVESSSQDNLAFQLTLIDIREHETGRFDLAPIQLEDWRQEADPLARLASLLAQAPDSLVWAEAHSRQQHPTWKRRAELTPCSSLIILTTPSDLATVQAVVERVQPQIVRVFAVPPPLASLDAFLGQLKKAAQNVIDHLDGTVRVDVLCGATAQSPQVVRAGLEFLVADGKLGSVTWRKKSSILIAPASGIPESNNSSATARERLEAAYREVEAYRRYFRSAPLDRLL